MRLFNVNSFQYSNNISVLNYSMLLQAPLLSFDQIEELTQMIQGIGDLNKKRLDDVLSELVDLENTSVLGLYNLVCDEWTKKQKIVDNLCHLALSMMASIQLLWEQKYQHEQRISNADQLIDSLQRQVFNLTDQIESFKQRIIEAQVRIQFLSGDRERMEELYRASNSSTLNEGLCELHPSADKKCPGCDQNNVDKKQAEIILSGSKILIQKEEEIVQLRNEKILLETKIQEMIEQSELAKMQIELAEIAIKDALTYKTSYKSLIESNSQITLRNTTNQHANCFNEELECASNMETYHFQRHNSLQNDFICHEDLVHFASTPCFLLNESVRKNQLDDSHLSGHSIEDFLKTNKAFQKKDTPNQISTHSQILVRDNEQVNAPSQSTIQPQQINANDLISKFMIKKSEIITKKDPESSYTSSSSGAIPNHIRVNGKCQGQQKNGKQTNSLNKLLNLFSSKIVVNRIKKR